jgi:hypothetical protein
MVEELNTSGTPSGQDSRKRGFYSSALSGQLLADYEQALGVDGLDDEIAMLRAMIKFMVLNNPFNVSFMIRAFNCLQGLIRTKKTVFKQDDTSRLEKAFHNVFKDTPMPRGLAPA